GPEDIHLSVQYEAETVIEARGTTGLYLKGLTVGQSRGDGLLLHDVAGATLESVGAVHNGGYGLHATDSTALRLDDCHARGNDGTGIAIEDSNAEVTGCEAAGNLVGLRESGGGEVTLESSRLH